MMPTIQSHTKTREPMWLCHRDSQGTEMGSVQANVTLGSSSRDYGKPPSLSVPSVTWPDPSSHKEIAFAWNISQEKKKEHTFLQLGN